MKRFIKSFNILNLIFALCIFFALTSTSGAVVVLDVTDGKNVTYTLDITNTGGNSYTGDFIVDSSGYSGSTIYSGYYTFKLDGTIDSIDTVSANLTLSEWQNISPPQVQVVEGGGGFGNLLPGSSPGFSGRTGFYHEDYDNIGSLSIGNGLAIDGSSIYDFSFSFTSDSLNFEDGISLKGGYLYEMETGAGIKLKYNGISERLTHRVPEPSTLLLLGSGLIGLAIVGRKKITR